MIYVTHDQVEAMTLATKILVMKNGRIQQAGSPRDIYDRPTNTFVADFMGVPAINLMAAAVRFEGGAALIEIARQDEAAIHLRDLAPPPGLIARGDDPVTLGLRPEAIGDAPGRTDGLVQRVDCRLDVVEHAGSDTYAVVQAGGADITARLHGDSAVASGARTTLYFDLTKVCYFDPISGARL